MTSTTGSTIDPHLKFIFDWVPPLLTKDPRKDPRGTRFEASWTPSFYDKHLADDVVLKHVKLLPSLTNDITGMINEILYTIQKDNVVLPPLNQVISPQFLKFVMDGLTAKMINEISVCEFYCRSTGMFCPQAASLLALYPSLKVWKPVLWCTRSSVDCGHANAGCSLEFSLNNLSPGTLDDKMMELLCSVEQRFPDLAIWEFKSQEAGTDQVMLGVRELVNTDIPFPWTRCEGVNCPSKRHDIVKPIVGPDGDDTPWILPSSSSSEDDFSGPYDQNEARQEERVEPTRLKVASNNFTQIFPTIKREERERDDDDDPSYQSAEEITAQYFVQQAWAEAVRMDATLIILNAGNFEYIGVRHRESQTLFLSNIVKIQELVDPGYGKIHIGIYAAALKDAISRFRKLSSSEGKQPD